jgi:hypothetical protein
MERKTMIFPSRDKVFKLQIVTPFRKFPSKPAIMMRNSVAQAALLSTSLPVQERAIFTARCLFYTTRALMTRLPHPNRATLMF